MCRYIPLTLIEQTNSTEQVDAPEEQTHATEEQAADEPMSTTDIPQEQVYHTPEEQMNVADDPEKVVSKDQDSTHFGEESRKRARDELSSPDTISPSNYTCIESDPASESVIDLTQDSP